MSLALRRVLVKRPSSTVSGSRRALNCRRGLSADPDSPGSPSAAEGTRSSTSTPMPRHVLSPYERFIVRITRSHSGTDVPTTMGPEAMDRVNSRFRIGLMVVMMTLTLGVCLRAIQQGKRQKAAHSNEMVSARNRERYK